MTFKWSMPQHFGTKGADGMVDFHWDRARKIYDDDYVNPPAWRVDFDACSPDMPPGSRFQWQIDQEMIPNLNPTSCTFSHEFANQGTYTVKLTREAPDGTLAITQAPVTVKDLLIVSLGDSFASGQGNPDIPKAGSTPAKWVDTICARSATAGPAKAALDIEEMDAHTSVTFLSFACSGASIGKGILGKQPKGGVELDSQIDQLTPVLNKRPIDALIISIGGNDIGFAQLVARCVVDYSCDRHSKSLNKKLDQLRAGYQLLSDSISKVPGIKRIFITEYPDLVRDQNGMPCDRAPQSDPFLKRIDGQEAEWASISVIAGLNGTVKKAADTHHWVYVGGIADQFRKHGYCTGDSMRWVRTFNEAKLIQGFDSHCNILHPLTTVKHCLFSSGSVHPSKGGHEVYAASLVEALRKEGVIAPPGS